MFGRVHKDLQHSTTSTVLFAVRRHTSCSVLQFSHAFAKLQKAAISFVMSVYPFVHIEKLGSHWADFNEIWYLRFSRKSVEKIQVPLKPDKTNGYFT